MNDQSKSIAIVGAGLTGPLLGISLAKRGLKVDIYERRPDMRGNRVSAGRSINLAISTRGIHALRQAGLWDEMRRAIVPMKGRMMHALSGEITFQPYGKDETEVINSISRADLNVALINAAEASGATFHFGERCVGLDAETLAPKFRNEVSGKETTIEPIVTFGADGAGSAVRNEMKKLGSFDFSQSYLDYGYKELTIPAAADGSHRMDPNALHIWPRGSYMLIALPNIDGTFACILFLPFEGENSFQTLGTENDIRDFFAERFPDAVPLMPQMTQQFLQNPTGSMVTVKCAPWRLGDKVLLLGDAAHAIVPFFGQGMNCAFEDCTALTQLIDKYELAWPRIFAEFVQSRKADTDAIADMANENFLEMRDRVADPHFLFKKKIELALESRYPGVFIPKYAMVTFHRIPYSVARARGDVQERILNQLCDSRDSVEQIDWRKAEGLIREQLTPLENL
jgi:kynurenine 3-monooxygenase